MMERGFLREVEALHDRGDLGPHLPSIRCVGYRQLWAHLDGETSLRQAVDSGMVATRQLAKRQLTWLRAEPATEWLDALDPRVGALIVGKVAGWLDTRLAGQERSV